MELLCVARLREVISVKGVTPFWKFATNYEKVVTDLEFATDC